MTKQISEARLRNTRAWAAVRVGQLSGAEVIVGPIDELLELRAAMDEALCVLDTEAPVTASRLRKSLKQPDEPTGRV